MTDLDLKTVAVMLIVFSAGISLFLLTSKANPQKVSGAGYWSLGGFLLSLGMMVVISTIAAEQWSNPSRWSLLGDVLITAGLSLNVLGIQVFSNRRPSIHLIYVVLGLILLLNALMLIGDLSREIVTMLNVLIYASLDLAAAYYLFRIHDHGLRGWHWFNGGLFLLVGIGILFKVAFNLSIYNVMMLTFHEELRQEQGEMYWMLVAVSVKQLLNILGFSQMMYFRRMNKLHELAMFDHLTHAYNRRGLMEAAESMAANCIRTGFDLSMVVFDLDRFKRINDTYGHAVGDRVIKAFADTVRFEVRAGDLFGRYGGEEFCLLLPNTNEYDAMLLANRIRERFGALEMLLSESIERFTVSAGLSCSAQVGYDFKGLLAASDSALYAAKQQGRNKVVTHTNVSMHLE